LDHVNQPPRVTLGCVVVVLAMFFCAGGVTFVFDRVCNSYLTRYLQIYPNATITYRAHNMFTDFGVGNTVMFLESPDDQDTVRSWHGRTYGTFLRETLRSTDPLLYVGRRLARVDWDVTESESGTGSQIILFGTCIN
jgi:hypothetical protein